MIAVDGVVVISGTEADRQVEIDRLAARRDRRHRIDTICTQARAALAVNAEFLALGQPTNADAIAQLRHLTRMVNGLVRLQGDLVAGLADLLDTDEETP